MTEPFALASPCLRQHLEEDRISNLWIWQGVC